LFKDLSNLTLTTDWFSLSNDLQFTYDLISSLLLFFLIFLFLSKSKQKHLFNTQEEYADDANISRFIKIKKLLATCLIPVLIIIAVYSLSSWAIGALQAIKDSEDLMDNINNIFFEQFFTVLIIADVVLLLFSFFYTDDFHKVIRNSGFIISTILIRLSFSVEGLLNNLLIISSVIFGLLILMIHNKFEELNNKENPASEKSELTDS
jgi:preprotein translocase subunit SecY